MEEKKRIYEIAKIITIQVKKEFEFDILKTLRFFDDFYKKINANKMTIELDNHFWHKGLIKNNKIVKKYKKGIEKFIEEHGNKKYECNSIISYAKIEEKTIMLMFTAVNDLNNKISSYSLMFNDCEWYLNSDRDEELLSRMKDFTGDKFIIKSEISDYKKTLSKNNSH